MSQEERVARGKALDEAVALFEAGFEHVDDHYMHTGESRTVEGARFIKLYPGSPDATAPVSFSDNYAGCVEAWLADVLEFVSRRPEATILFWRKRPHFITLESGGLTIESSFVAMIPADISDATKERWAGKIADAVEETLAAAPPAPAPKKGGRKAPKAGPVEPPVPAEAVPVDGEPQT